MSTANLGSFALQAPPAHNAPEAHALPRDLGTDPAAEGFGPEDPLARRLRRKPPRRDEVAGGKAAEPSRRGRCPACNRQS